MTKARSAAVNVARALESGAFLGVLVILLAVTGLLLSPTASSWFGASAVQAGAGNVLYAMHVAAAGLLVVFTLIHLWPLSRALGLASRGARRRFTTGHLLLIFIVAETVTGLVLWTRWYGVFPKAVAAQTHLYLTFILLAPLVPHALRGWTVWRDRRNAKAAATAAAARVGRVETLLEKQRAVTRRAFIRITTFATAGVALAFWLGQSVTGSVKAWRLNYIGDAPPLTKENWRLHVAGRVDEPFTLTYDELLAMPSITRTITHRCVEGWTYTDEFTGVLLKDVLARAKVLPDAAQVVFTSPEVSNHPRTRGQNYSTNFPVNDAVDGDALIAYRVGNEDMPKEHGGPVRLMTPSKWGYKACKWMTGIEVTSDASYRGYWERLGYHNDGDWPGPIFA